MSTRVYVGRLPPQVDENDIEKMFSEFGPILRLNKKNEYAFVDFEDKRDAEMAIRAMDGQTVHGYRIVVELAKIARLAKERSRSPRRKKKHYSQQNYKIEIKGLDPNTSWQDLKDHFRDIGEVCFSKVIYHDDGSIKKGIIEFKNKEDMYKAEEQMNETLFKGSTIYVKAIDSESISSSRSRSSSRSPRKRSRSRTRKYKSSKSSDSLSRSRSRSRRRKSRSRSRSCSRSRRKKRSRRSRSRSSSSSRSRSTSKRRRSRRRKRSRSRTRKSRRSRKSRSRTRKYKSSKSSDSLSRSRSRSRRRKSRSRSGSKSRKSKRSQSDDSNSDGSTST